MTLSLRLVPLLNITNPAAWTRHVNISAAWLCHILAFAQAHPCPKAEVSFLFTSNRRMRTLNKHHRGFDKPTNVLSFPGDPDDPAQPCLGDLALGFECIAGESRRLGVSFDAHLSRIIIHGILHLLGFDHQTPPEQTSMEALEAQLLTTLGFTHYPFKDDPTL